MKIKIFVCLFALIGCAAEFKESGETKEKYLFIYETSNNKIFLYLLELTYNELHDFVNEVDTQNPKVRGKAEKPYGDVIIISNDQHEILYRILLKPGLSARHTLEQMQMKSLKKI